MLGEGKLLGDQLACVVGFNPIYGVLPLPWVPAVLSPQENMISAEGSGTGNTAVVFLWSLSPTEHIFIFASFFSANEVWL